MKVAKRLTSNIALVIVLATASLADGQDPFLPVPSGGNQVPAPASPATGRQGPIRNFAKRAIGRNNTAALDSGRKHPIRERIQKIKSKLMPG